MKYSIGDTVEFRRYSNPGIVLEAMKRKEFFNRFERSHNLVKWIVFWPDGPRVGTRNHGLPRHNVYYHVLIGDKKGWVTDNMIKDNHESKR